jgi:HK97 family phage portal protein
MGLFSMFGGGAVAQASASASGTRDPGDDFWYGRVGKPSAAGVKVTIESARTVPVVRGCLQVLSETVAGLSFSVFERDAGDQRRKRAGHPVARLLANPNPRETSYEFFANLVDDLASHGRFLAERQSWGREERLWRISPDHFQVEMLSDRSLRFRVTEPGRGERVLLDEDAWYIPLPPVQNGMMGRSPILQDGVEAIGAALALQRYANSFFANDATPPVIFTHKGNFADQASKENFLSAWQRFFGGRNRHKPGILEYGMGAQQLAHSNEQAQFLETRKELWLDVSRLWRIPPHKLGILDKATFSNIEHQSLEFVTDTLGPWLELIERSVNKWFLDGAREYFEFNVASLLRGDIKTRFEAYAIARQWGWLSVNEIRRLENQNGIGRGGDRFIEPLNMVPVGDAGQKEGTSRAIAFLRESVEAGDAHRNMKVVTNVA